MRRRLVCREARRQRPLSVLTGPCRQHEKASAAKRMASDSAEVFKGGDRLSNTTYRGDIVSIDAMKHINT